MYRIVYTTPTVGNEEHVNDLPLTLIECRCECVCLKWYLNVDMRFDGKRRGKKGLHIITYIFPVTKSDAHYLYTAHILLVFRLLYQIMSGSNT